MNLTPLLGLTLTCALALVLPHAVSAQPANPLLEPWPGPHGGFPPFARIEPRHFGPALEASTVSARHQIEAIAADPHAPTFENTVVALERVGRLRNRVLSMYGTWIASRSSPEFRRVETEWGPKLAAFDDEIVQYAELWKRIDAVRRSRAATRLAPEDKRLLDLTVLRFVRSGAALDNAAKVRVAAINGRLATLTTAFSQNERADEEEEVLHIEDAAQLAGLLPEMVVAASAEARRRSLTGWAFMNTRSAIEPLLTLADDRGLRERAFRIWTRRGDHPDPADPRHAHDNGPLVVEILALRAERSRLLGYPSYAHWRLAESMAASPERALGLLMDIWKPAIEAVRADVEEMRKLASVDPQQRIEPWDYRYDAEKLRRARYDFDASELAPYLQLDHVREAMFMMAGKLYGLRFDAVPGLPVIDPAMRAWEVRRKGRFVGLWYFDPYAREGKGSGAWMRPVRLQRRLDGDVAPLVTNSANFIAGRDGQQTRLSWDDALTMFHEFGHALHGLLSDVTYGSLASPHALLDFGEMPSQMHENFLLTPEVLALLVNEQGQPIPPPLLERLRRSNTFNQGFLSTEYLASAIVDLWLHASTEPVTDPAAFEARLDTIGMPKEIVMRHRIPQFGHVFADEPGYAAAYYGYQWASVLDRDAFAAFTETGNPYDPATARRLVTTILSRGNTVDPAIAFRRFRGRDARVDAMLRAKGFPVPAISALPR